ncbi:MAG: DUF2169 domain-containing protein, partial [Pseudomonadota bacterium]
MQIDNGTPFQAGYTVGLDTDGREHAVVVVKASYRFPEKHGAPCQPAEVQEPLLMADTFWGEPGFSAPRAEMDFARIKPRCDVLLEATAHAPGQRAVAAFQVGIRIGGWAKALDVVGDRVWLTGLGPPRISEPRPFVTMPLTYERAFGGTDRSDPAVADPFAYPPNPVGRGWHREENVGRLNGQPLPNLERPGTPVRVPWDNAA